MGGKIPDSYYFYHYNPSIAAAVLFIILFGTATAFHLYKLVKTKTWYFIPFVLGGQTEVVGYVGRILSHNKINGQSALGAYIVQSTCLLVAAALYAASIYMILVRLSHLLHAEKHLPMRSTWLTKFFVLADILSFNIQGLGGGLMAAVSLKSLGEKLIIAGIWIQIVFFGIFVIFLALFYYRLRQDPTNVAIKLAEVSGRNNWRKLMSAVSVASALILIRSIFRLIEYSQGEDGYLLQNEAWLYVFDASLMFLVMVVFAVLHPSNVVPGRRGTTNDAFEEVGFHNPNEMT